MRILSGSIVMLSGAIIYSSVIIRDRWRSDIDVTLGSFFLAAFVGGLGIFLIVSGILQERRKP